VVGGAVGAAVAAVVVAVVAVVAATVVDVPDSGADVTASGCTDGAAPVAAAHEQSDIAVAATAAARREGLLPAWGTAAKSVQRGSPGGGWSAPISLRRWATSSTMR
jgi:hypothetical protein